MPSEGSFFRRDVERLGIERGCRWADMFEPTLAAVVRAREPLCTGRIGGSRRWAVVAGPDSLPSPARIPATHRMNIEQLRDRTRTRVAVAHRGQRKLRIDSRRGYEAGQLKFCTHTYDYHCRRTKEQRASAPAARA